MQVKVVDSLNSVVKYAPHIFHWSDDELEKAIISHVDLGTEYCVECRCCLYLRAYRTK